jgi:hypothetical protein
MEKRRLKCSSPWKLDTLVDSAESSCCQGTAKRRPGWPSLLVQAGIAQGRKVERKTRIKGISSTAACRGREGKKKTL